MTAKTTAEKKVMNATVASWWRSLGHEKEARQNDHWADGTLDETREMHRQRMTGRRYAQKLKEAAEK